MAIIARQSSRSQRALEASVGGSAHASPPTRLLTASWRSEPSPPRLPHLYRDLRFRAVASVRPTRVRFETSVAMVSPGFTLRVLPEMK